jgi:hypothetical protein
MNRSKDEQTIASLPEQTNDGGYSRKEYDKVRQPDQ